MRSWAGRPLPLGATWDGRGTNFSVFSANATAVDLLLFEGKMQPPKERVPLAEKSGYLWHAYLPDVGPGKLYAYSVDGPHEPNRGHRFNKNKALLDPYAKAVAETVEWDDALFGYRIGDPAEDLSFDERDSSPFSPKGVVVDQSFDWEGDRPPRTPWNETIIYELHVKGFTRLKGDLEERLRGTYAGLATPSTVAYIKDMGVTAVELMPIHHHVDNKFLVEKGLSNFWGYNTIGYFAPDSRYSSSGILGEQVSEFKAMVKALHSAGLEIILDVVYNHTAEGNQYGPTLSFKGFENRAYYKLDRKDMRQYYDVTGTGNTLNVHNPFVLKMIMDSLRYWVTEMHVDGFRFDLAPALARGDHEFDRFSTFLEVVNQDPVLSEVKLIAEPWDLGHGGHQLGNFPPPWAEWNGRYRDTVRKYWGGHPTHLSELATRLAGSSDMYGGAARGPSASVNYVTCHDGFTLNDLVSYNLKHNEANEEENGDGTDDNHSWNCGHEGPTDDPAVNQLRKRQMMNLIATLLLSQGVPMLLAGDERRHSKMGNNNSYCQDNALNWLDWSESPENDEFLRFTRAVIGLRRAHPVFRRSKFFQGRSVSGELKDLAWMKQDGTEVQPQEWRSLGSQPIGMLLAGSEMGEYAVPGEKRFDDTFLLVLNGSPNGAEFTVPEHVSSWEVALDTGGTDQPKGAAPAGRSVKVAGRSVLLLRKIG